MTAIEMIAAERAEQIEKHNRTLQYDFLNNANGELLKGAISICGEFPAPLPAGWDSSWGNYTRQKTKVERLVIMAAMIAAEIDRLQWKTLFEYKPGDGQMVIFLDLTTGATEQFKFNEHFEYSEQELKNFVWKHA